MKRNFRFPRKSYGGSGSISGGRNDRERNRAERASTGEFEALELRDGDKARYGGKGVTKAVQNINTIINETLTGMDASDIYAVDRAMIKADGTKDKSKLEQTRSLQYRSHAHRAASISLDIPLYRFLGGSTEIVFQYQ